jgi:hypothetical protein
LPGGLASDGAVHGGPCDAEQVAEFGGAVLTGFRQGDQVCFLARVELGLLAPQPTLGLGDSHALLGAQPDEVGLEFGDHGQHVEQQPADRVGRVVDGPAEVQPHPSSRELVGDRPGVG